jgi:hypothetical protein
MRRRDFTGAYLSMHGDCVWIGIHRVPGHPLLSPVSRMKLVEVIPAFETDEAALTRVTQIMEGIGKNAIRVKDVAGFAGRGNEP